MFTNTTAIVRTVTAATAALLLTTTCLFAAAGPVAQSPAAVRTVSVLTA